MRQMIKDMIDRIDDYELLIFIYHATATGDIRSMSKKRHALLFDFVKRFRSNANLRFTLTTEPMDNRK